MIGSESTESSVMFCGQFHKWGSGEVECMQEQHGLSEEEEEENEERLRSQQVALDMVIKKGTESDESEKNHNKVFKETKKCIHMIFKC